MEDHSSGDHPGQEVQFLGENQKEELTVYTDDILFIKSEGNYITIGYLKNAGSSRPCCATP